MHITALGLHLTDRCDAKCGHCAYHCGPEAKDLMKLVNARDYLEQGIKQGAGILCISGGEPLLFPDLTNKLSREAGKLGMQSIWVFTNAHWATNRESAEKCIARLKSSGVTRICLSADGFHTQFVPAERLKVAVTAASKLGLELVLDTRISGKSLQEDNPINRSTIETLRLLGDLWNVETWRGSLLYVGRAAEMLAPKVPVEPGFLGGPRTGPWAGGSWTNPVGVDIDSYGEVTLCPGISIGNAKRHRLSKILSQYSPSEHRIIRELSAGGPKSLLRVAHGIGYRPLAGYLTACHLCYDVRKFMRLKYPSELAPPSCYGEISFNNSA